MSQIETFTQEQLARIPEFREKWMRSLTQPSDHAAAEYAIERLYHLMNLDRPFVIWGHSPFHIGCIDLLVRICRCKKLRRQLDTKIWEHSAIRLDDQFWKRLETEMMEHLGNLLRDQSRNKLFEALGDGLCTQIEEKLRTIFEKQVRNQLFDELDNQLGRHDESRLFHLASSRALFIKLSSNQLGRDESRHFHVLITAEMLNGSSAWAQISGQLTSHLKGKLEPYLKIQLRKFSQVLISNWLANGLINEI